MIADDRRGAVGLFLLIVALTSAFLAVHLVLGRRNAFRQMEELALARVQLIREITDGTLREAQLIVAEVSGGSIDELGADLRRRLLFAEQLGNAAVYDSHGQREYVMSQVGMDPPIQLPNDVLLRHRTAGSGADYFVVARDDGPGALWITHRIPEGGIVAANILPAFLSLQLRFGLARGMIGSVGDSSGTILASWPADAGRGVTPAAGDSLSGVERLTVDTIGRWVVASVQLRDYPLTARIAIGPEVVLEQWYAQLPWIGAYFLGGHAALAAYLVQTIRRRRQEWQTQERELLVRETNHRVKNNLMIIDSMLSLSATGTDDENSLRVIAETRGRVASVALIHELLYADDSLEDIPFDSYCERLVAHIQTAIESSESTSPLVRIDTNVDSLRVSAEAARRFGLIIHELITNAVKHAVPIDEDGVLRLKIVFSRRQSRWYLEIHDNGRLRDDAHLKTSHGIGMTIVRSLIEEMDATLHYVHDQGTHVTIEGDVLYSRHGTDEMPVVR
ncbi:MAG: sensor histidine kinase [Alkalispirochaeta sp.]